MVKRKRRPWEDGGIEPPFAELALNDENHPDAMSLELSDLSSSSEDQQQQQQQPPIETLFRKLAAADDAGDGRDRDPTAIGLLGIARLSEQLGLDPDTDVRVLVLCWKLGSREKPASIAKKEFVTGCSELNVDSIERFRALVPSLDTGLMDRDEFRRFYRFCFRFHLEEVRHSTLDKDTVVSLWKTVLKGRIPDDRLESFCGYVETQTSYPRITLDQWASFLEFCYECDDLSAYDESTSAWPVLIDEFVEHMEKQQQQQEKMKTKG